MKEVPLDSIRRERIDGSLALVKLQPAAGRRSKVLEKLEIWALVYFDQQDAILHRSEFSSRIDREVLRLLIDAFEDGET